MDPRTNGHEDDAREPERPRLRGEGPAPRPSSSDRLRAVDQLARLEARIRDFHHNLDSLDAAEADLDGLAASTGRHADAADNLVSRAADAARLAASIGETSESGTAEDAADAGETAADEVGGEAAEGEAAEGEAAEIEVDATPRQNGSAQPPAVTPSAGPGGSTYTGPERRRRSDARSDGPFSAQRRIDALAPKTSRPGGRETAAPLETPSEARTAADQIRLEAERRADRLHRDAAREAAQIREDAEQEMQHLWEALEAEVETIQAEISDRVDGLAGRMEAVSRESEEIRRRAAEDAERIRAVAHEEADQIRARAAEDAEGLLAIAEREAHALIADARAQAQALAAHARSAAEAEPVNRTPAADASGIDRNAAERIAEQIRDATAALTRRVSRAGDGPAVPHQAREIRGAAAVPNSIREVLDGLGAAVTLIERSLAGLAELLGETLGAERPEDG